MMIPAGRRRGSLIRADGGTNGRLQRELSDATGHRLNPGSTDAEQTRHEHLA
ncbi:hypothetical protein IV498_13990 [Paenarthrobacter sp. Z7-10]|nr:hypothetical protein [Paenarthrobacter sp. Z7-10]